ncbi:sensor histidine kinase [Aureimonas sp. ME7]|uniref:sensor histidine kinase n=1 Tax=Aureimonas sp. ME7 TaxID=2744252 RepID=UPI0015F4521D|nr:sensor histidine kinase [Aureimonas sp. ME7]
MRVPDPARSCKETPVRLLGRPSARRRFLAGERGSPSPPCRGSEGECEGDADTRAARRTLPIRWHLLIFAALILLPQLVLCAGLGWWYAASEHQRVEESAADAAAAIRSQLDRELEAMKAALQALATSPNVEREDFTALRTQALKLLETRGTLISVRDRAHRQVMNTLLPAGSPLPTSYDPALLEADARVFSQGQPTVSDLYTGALTHQSYILVDVPLEVGGAVRYAMNMAISPDMIGEIPSNAGLPADWIATVLDGRGRVIARSLAQDRFIGQAAPAQFLEAIDGVRSGTIPETTSLSGAPVFAAFDKLDTSDWRVVVAVPRSALDAPVRWLALGVGAVILLTLATSVALARLYSRRLVREVVSLQAMAAATGTGTGGARRQGRVGELEAIAGALEASDRSLRERDRQKDLLLAELNHRVRNTLSVLLSVVNHTLRSPGSDEALADRASGRIMALSRAHDLLSHSEWSATALSKLAARTAEEERVPIRCEGPEIAMRAEAVAPMAQALHELAVNQRLHGGLGGPQPVVLRTAIEGESLRLEWISPPGAGASAPPSDFGLRLVHLCLERQLFGRIERLDASGLRASLPMRFLTGIGLPDEPFAARWRAANKGSGIPHRPADER